MKFFSMHIEKVKNQTGVSAVIVAIVLTMLLGFAALAIDVGYMYVTRNELQNVADASALAAAGYMGSIYKTLSYSEQQTYEFVRSDIVTATNEVAQKNKAAGINIGINDSDVTIGTWAWDADTDTGTLTPMASPIVGPDAVRVIARRDGSANLPITTFFARIFGITDVNVVAQATAALTGPAVVAEGELKTPFALSESNLADCTELITFSPTTESCAAWHNFFDPINAATLPAKMLGLIQGDVQEYEGLVSGPQWLLDNFDISANKTPDPLVTPEVEAGDEFTFQGGTVASLFLGGVLGNKDNDI
ncbi:MAG: pilus assembly protein TadG-related protein, partial [Sedimentisphaerales bacterium]|nr:pilus assembly protein TadG-related protein [Sedimentisphaerales bacterium]